MDILLDSGSSLQQRDYTLIIDQSESMGIVEAGGKTRWELIQDATLALATQCEQFDPDGLTIYLFADRFTRYDNVTCAIVPRIFDENKPSGKTYLTPVLKHATDSYFMRRATGYSQLNGETIIVITAGEVMSHQGVKDVIINAANQLQRDEEMAISLIQVGDNPQVTQFFRVLDNELLQAGAKFDICDTLTLTNMAKISLTDVLLNAIVG
jgi:hypothetical protein